MSWIVESKYAAEQGGADMKNDEVMYAITPETVGELFNTYMSHRDPVPRNWTCANPPDYWEKLTDDERDQYLESVHDYIYKRMRYMDDGLLDALERVRKSRFHIREAAEAIVRIALALDDQSEKTGQTPLEILDIACVNYRQYNPEFDGQGSPDSQFGQLLGRAFLEGKEYDPGTIEHEGEHEDEHEGEYQEWWYENVILKFNQRYEGIPPDEEARAEADEARAEE